jgi:hypothetical protein
MGLEVVVVGVWCVVWLAVVVSRQNYNYRNCKSKSIVTIIAKIIVIYEYCGVCDGCGCFESTRRAGAQRSRER